MPSAPFPRLAMIDVPLYASVVVVVGVAIAVVVVDVVVVIVVVISVFIVVFIVVVIICETDETSCEVCVVDDNLTFVGSFVGVFDVESDEASEPKFC